MFIVTDRRAARIEGLLTAIANKLDIIIEEEEIELQELDDLAAEVAANSAVEASAITLINGLAAQIAAAGTDPAKLKALTDSLTASSNDLAAAVAANTPAAPAP